MKYFTIEELTDSSVARQLHIDNTPTAEIKENLTALVRHILDPARTALGKPIRVNSGYRCTLLNTCVGGAQNSQHLRGEAADICTGSPEENRKLFEILLNMPFDQLIWERGNSHGPAWIHVSYRRNGNNRGEVIHL
ncbi:MAG: peptidase M15 [Bacteroidaceae bacterium]|nr:peptidase M15 [Bacteroidaceae bacterium]MBR4069698.1 peptidase M15 [Bacteroidaceae bacterium]